MKNQVQLFFWFMGIWVGIGLIGVWILQISKDIERKQRLLRLFIIGKGVHFGGFSIHIMRTTDAALPSFFFFAGNLNKCLDVVMADNRISFWISSEPVDIPDFDRFNVRLRYF